MNVAVIGTGVLINEPRRMLLGYYMPPLSGFRFAAAPDLVRDHGETMR